MWDLVLYALTPSAEGNYNLCSGLCTENLSSGVVVVKSAEDGV
jgi:hypothetical protein